MIRVKVQRSARDGFVEFFKVSGHAGYAGRGEDIVCSAVTAVVFTAVGYAESLYNPTEDTSKVCYEQSSGFVVWRCPDVDEETRRQLKPVLDAMVLGLKQICESSGKKYLVVFD